MQGVTDKLKWDAETFKAVLEQVSSNGTIKADLMTISAQDLEQILEAAPRDRQRPERSVLKDARFGGTTFEGKASFRKVNFVGTARFADATFEGPASFEKATFVGDAKFDDAKFQGESWFPGALFECHGSFRGATFEGQARFDAAKFRKEARFERAKFRAEAHFPRVICGGRARLRDAAFGGFAHFPDATFGSDAEFRGADLKAGFRLGPTVIVGRLELDDASLGNVDLRVSTCHLSCKGTRFHEPAHLKVRWAEVHLDEGVFDRASTLALSPPWRRVDETKLPPCQGLKPGSEDVAKKEAAGETPAMPRLKSLLGADVANLTLADINLEACVFESTLNLDQLRLATRCPFAQTPSGHFRRRRSPPWVWRWTKRMTVCEEGTWRVRRWEVMTHRREDWRADWTHVLTDCGTETVSGSSATATEARREREADRLAKIYRGLRKGREDERNSPGAGDFYYGEMEMRRHGEASGLERVVIWLYWLVSGYGLRASRALTALALTVVVFAFLIDWWGFRPDRDFGRTLLFSIESTSSLFRVPETEGFALTDAGEVLQVIVRLLGPLFFGLALLSLRGRVKR